MCPCLLNENERRHGRTPGNSKKGREENARRRKKSDCVMGEQRCRKKRMQENCSTLLIEDSMRGFVRFKGNRRDDENVMHIQEQESRHSYIEKIEVVFSEFSTTYKISTLLRIYSY